MSIDQRGEFTGNVGRQVTDLLSASGENRDCVPIARMPLFTNQHQPFTNAALSLNDALPVGAVSLLMAHPGDLAVKRPFAGTPPFRLLQTLSFRSALAIARGTQNRAVEKTSFGSGTDHFATSGALFWRKRGFHRRNFLGRVKSTQYPSETFEGWRPPDHIRFRQTYSKQLFRLLQYRVCYSLIAGL